MLKIRRKKRASSDDNMAAQQIERNIAAILRLEQTALENRRLSDRLAATVGRFVGRLSFVVVQLVFFAGWLAINGSGSPFRFDPYPHNWLMLIVGLEAILLSTFVLISQHQMQKLADRRAHLNLQIDLLAESEMTKILVTFRAIVKHLGVPGIEDDQELRDLSTRTEVEHVAQALDEQLAGPAEPKM
jgi:uncharacterized membrane protein